MVKKRRHAVFIPNQRHKNPETYWPASNAAQDKNEEEEHKRRIKHALKNKK